MKINKVIVENFKSFEKHTEINFDEFNGLWRINGEVGAGKTSILEMILFGLYGELNGKKNADIVTWGKKSCKLELFLESSNKSIHIERITKAKGASKFECFINDVQLEETNKKALQTRLESEYYDVSATVVKQLCMISFNDFKSISTMSKTETRDFLDSVFGLYILTNYTKSAKEHETKYKFDIAETNGAINSLKMQINRLDNEHQDLVQQSLFDAEHTAINELNEKINLINENIHTIEISRDDLLSVDKKLINSKSEKLSEYLMLGKSKRKELNTFKSGKCPTCGNSMPIDYVSNIESELNAVLNDYKLLNSEITELKNESNNRYSEFNDKIKPLKLKKSEYNNDIQEHNYKLREFEAKNRQIKSQKIVDNEKLENDISIYETKLNKLDSEKTEWRELITLLDGTMRFEILKHFIPTINKNTNFFLQSLAQEYNVNFDNQFKCTITSFGNELIPITNLSTGQLKIVDTAMIFGILNTVLTNVDFNISFLDELLNNLDEDLRNQTCNMLKKNLNKQVIFVISHASLDDMYFDGNIFINRKQTDNGLRSELTIN